MLERNRVQLATVILAILLLPSLTAAQSSEPATPASEGRQDNVLLTVRIGRLDTGKRQDVKSYDIVIVGGGVGSTLLSGARVPIPTTRRDDGKKDGAADEGMTSFVYQNIGFSTEVRAWILDDERIKLVANLEDSRLQEAPGDAPPIVETRQLSINAILEQGVPLEVSRVEGLRDQSGFVELEAKILN